MNNSFQDDMRLIEAGFPCHQVGAETQRERGASSGIAPIILSACMVGASAINAKSRGNTRIVIAG